jgi:ribosome-binding factor A
VVTHQLQLKYSPELVFIYDEEQANESAINIILKKRFELDDDDMGKKNLS